MSVPTLNLNFGAGSSVKSSSFSGGLFINNEFVAGEGGKTIEVINPSTGEKIGEVSEASPKDVDRAVEAAQKAFDTVWGLNTTGTERGKLMMKMAVLIEENLDEIAAVESLDNGKAFSIAKGFDIAEVAGCFRYYAGWADKIHGKVIEVNNDKMAYTRHEPIGVVGQIIPWNFPALMFAWKL